MKTEAIRVHGATFVCHRLGTGPRTALLLHGFPDDASSMHGLMRSLADRGFTCWAPFLRGYGPSESMPGGDYTLVSLAEDLLALARTISPGAPVTLIGHDWGALISYTAAALDSSAFCDLVAMGVSPTLPMTRAIFRHPAQLRRSAYIFLFQLPWISERLVRQGDLALVEALWRAWSPGWTVPEAHLRQVKETLSTEGSLPCALSYYRGLLLGGALTHPRSWARTMHTHLRRKIQTRTLILAGEDDGCAGVACYERAASAFAVPPEVRFLPGCGHFPHLEHPGVVAEHTLAFLQDGDGERPRQATSP